MSKVVVLSKKEGFCPACTQTKKWLEREGVDFEEIPVTAESPEFISVNQATEFRQMPIVLPKGMEDFSGAFTGFNINKLRELKG